MMKPANPLSRKVHKEMIRLDKLAVELNKKHPEPMSLFRKREKNGEVPSEPWPKPDVTLGKLDRSARAMADWDNSDPFAYGRTYLHVKQGYLTADEVIKEMTQRTTARRVAKSREVERAKSETSSAS